jgi:hypothetical protein
MRLEASDPQFTHQAAWSLHFTGSALLMAGREGSHKPPHKKDEHEEWVFSLTPPRNCTHDKETRAHLVAVHRHTVDMIGMRIRKDPLAARSQQHLRVGHLTPTGKAGQGWSGERAGRQAGRQADAQPAAGHLGRRKHYAMR